MSRYPAKQPIAEIAPPIQVSVELLDYAGMGRLRLFPQFYLSSRSFDEIPMVAGAAVLSILA